MYTDMKGELMNYLAGFAREGRVVKEQDIKEFFKVGTGGRGEGSQRAGF